MVEYDERKEQLFDFIGNADGLSETQAQERLQQYDVIEKREEYVDYLNKEISKSITSTLPFEGTREGSRVLNSLFSVTSNIERISDHALNIANEMLQMAIIEKE